MFRIFKLPFVIATKSKLYKSIVLLLNYRSIQKFQRTKMVEKREFESRSPFGRQFSKLLSCQLDIFLRYIFWSYSGMIRNFRLAKPVFSQLNYSPFYSFKVLLTNFEPSRYSFNILTDNFFSFISLDTFSIGIEIFLFITLTNIISSNEA